MAAKEKTRKLAPSIQEHLSLLFTLLALCILGIILSDVFLSSKNIMNILRSASLTMITCVGMVLILLCGEMDMSVGSSQGLIGVICVYLLNRTGSIAAAVLLSLLVGALLGLINGLLVTKAKINSLVVTLGTMAIFRGAAFVSTGGVSLQVKSEHFKTLGTGSIASIPIPLIIALATVLIAIFILRRTVFGRYIYAIGGNTEAALLAGVAVERIKNICFSACGVLTAISAILLSSRMDSGQPSAGDGFEFSVVSAAVLGGVSLNGGKGNMIGGVLGVLILSVLSNILTLRNVSSFYQQIARGVVILLAVYLDGRSSRAAERRLLRQKIA